MSGANNLDISRSVRLSALSLVSTTGLAPTTLYCRVVRAIIEEVPICSSNHFLTIAASASSLKAVWNSKRTARFLLVVLPPVVLIICFAFSLEYLRPGYVCSNHGRTWSSKNLFSANTYSEVIFFILPLAPRSIPGDTLDLPRTAVLRPLYKVYASVFALIAEPITSVNASLSFLERLDNAFLKTVPALTPVPDDSVIAWATRLSRSVNTRWVL